MPDFSRRDFLKVTTSALLTASGLLGLAGLLEFLSYQTEPAAKTEFDLGSAAAFPVGSRTVFADIPAVLIRTQSGFIALSLICTHLGCTVEQRSDGFACPCHGSLYNRNGGVVRGPAVKALRVLRLETAANGRLILHTN